MRSTLLERMPGMGTGQDHVRVLARVFVILGLFLAVPVSVRAQEPCTTDPDCDDGIGCTDDECIIGVGGVGTCWHISDCSDDEFCNGTEICCTEPGGCDGYPIDSCVPGTPIQCPPGQFCSESLDTCVFCETAADCDDNNQCTEDICAGQPLACIYTDIEGACDDNDLCTVDDICQDVCVGGDKEGEPCAEDFDCYAAIPGLCTGYGCAGTPRDCNAEAPECHSGTCVPSTGDCSFTQVGDGTACNDGDKCTAIDACVGGVCVGGPADGCVQLELRAAGGARYVGDLVEVKLYVWGLECAGSLVCGSGTIQAVAGMETMLSWDPAVLKLADPAEIGEPNPEDPCDDPDTCIYDCGYPNRRYNWSSSIFPNDCENGGAVNDPCSGIPGNDGTAFYLAYQQIMCDEERALPACVAGVDYDLWVTTFKFEVIGPTAGISGPTAIAIDDCINQTRTKVVSGSATGHDITGSLGDPVEFAVRCVDGSDCPLGICEDGVCLSCFPPVVEAEGPRYFAVTPAEGVPEVALWVTGVEPDVSCVYGYVRVDGRVWPCEEPPCTPPYLPPGPDGWGTVHVRGEEVMAGRTYEIQSDCNPGDPGTSLSEPVSGTLWPWADVDNSGGQISILDATKILDGFRGIFHGLAEIDVCDSDDQCGHRPPYYECDLDVHRCIYITLQAVDIIGAGYDQCCPEGVVSIIDVTVCLDAFRGFPDPCAVTRCQP